MAHIIARKSSGPRGQGQPGADGYENLILLCPTCHTIVDKDPAGHPSEMLHRWKSDHENQIRSLGASLKFHCIDKLKAEIGRILQENSHVWQSLGPKSAIASMDPSSNASEIWRLRKLDTILPNNAKILNIIQNNAELLTPSQYAAFLSFKSHARAFEHNQYDRLDNYPTFPGTFEKEFSS
jgi:hypothetical protein